ncbi:MAG TPA: BTAD domain-containing putative transcriptional regulator, partial [Acidimicrobiales bacterium]|nr:BTAD domain-containing putative transcriptional regulator [Acidimicrobiales bacterium]
MEGGVELRVLGPLTITGPDGTVIVRDGLPRKLLAALVVEGGSPVSSDALIELLWPEQAPNDARNALQVLVSYLRRQLDPCAPALLVERASGGYRLVVDPPEVLDVHRFEAGVAAVPDVVEGLPAEEATEHLAGLEATVELWRGPPFVDAAYDDFAQPEIARLTELRARAEELRAGLLLALGRPEDAVACLQRHLAENPLRESAWGLLMLALYRAGRQAEALRAFATVQERLVEELGIDPGPELRALEQRILEQDPGLDATGPAPPPIVVAPASLAPLASRVPSPLSTLVGRVFELEEVPAILAERRLVTLVGPGGVGKTRLAVEVAQELARTQTVVFVELGSLLDPEGLPSRLASEVGVRTTPDQDPVDAVAERLGDGPVVLVLDTCEHLLDAVAEVAVRLLRSKADLRLLATSRQPLGIEGEAAWRVPTLELADEGARGLIDVEPSGAVRLFVDRARAARPDFALTEENASDVARICRVLDGLPLAIALAAARANVLSPAQIVERLDDRFRLLSKGGRDAERRQQSLRS